MAETEMYSDYLLDYGGETIKPVVELVTPEQPLTPPGRVVFLREDAGPAEPRARLL